MTLQTLIFFLQLLSNYYFLGNEGTGEVVLIELFQRLDVAMALGWCVGAEEGEVDIWYWFYEEGRTAFERTDVSTLSAV